MGISVATPATNVQASPYSDASWGSFNGYLAGRAVNINDWDYGNLSDGNVEVKTKTGVTYVGDVVIPNTADLINAGIITDSNGKAYITTDTLKNVTKSNGVTSITISKNGNSKLYAKDTDLSYAFASSGTLQKLDVGALDTTGVDRIAQTFAMDHNLVEIDGLENWDVSKVTNFTSNFLSNYKIQCLVNLSNWEIQDNAHTDNMFSPSWVATPLMVIVKSGTQNINRGTDVFGKDNAQHYLYKVEINGQVVETLLAKAFNSAEEAVNEIQKHLGEIATSRNSCDSGSTNHGSSQTRKQA